MPESEQPKKAASIFFFLLVLINAELKLDNMLLAEHFIALCM